MKTMQQLGRVLAGAATLAAAFLVGAGDARAAGLELDASALDAQVQAELRADIARARVERPDVARAVDDVVSHAAEIDAKARARGAPLTARFKALGPHALLPMLDIVAFDARGGAKLDGSAAYALRVGLVEAIGMVRDARAVPVLSRIVQDARDERIVRAAASALARIGTDAAFAVVADAVSRAEKLEPASARERALLAGLHDCLRARAARFLADRLDRARDEATALVVIRSLGGTGNAWAWRASSAQVESAEARGIAAEALVRAFAARTGPEREAAAKALLVVDDPRTPDLLARARAAADEGGRVALDELARRFAENPARRRF